MVFGHPETSVRLGPHLRLGLNLSFMRPVNSSVCLVHVKLWRMLDKGPGIKHMALHSPHHLELLTVVIN
jgi:hypothetical protein